MASPTKDDGYCWQFEGMKGQPPLKPPQYLGRCVGFRLIGNPNDPDPEWTFERNKKISGLGLIFGVTECVFSEPDKEEKQRRAKEADDAAFAAKLGQGRRRRKTKKSKRRSRKTRRSRK